MDRSVSVKQVMSMINDNINKINTLFLAIVQEYNPITGKITVLPKLKMLANDDTYIDRAILFECPTCVIKVGSFYVRAPYSPGDVVYVGCCQDSLNNLLSDANTSVSQLEGVSKFRLTDAIIIGGIFVDTEKQMTQEFKSDFVIQNRDNDDIFVIKKDGGIYSKTSSKFQIDANDVEINSKTMVMNVETTTTNGNSISQNVSNTSNSGDVSISGNGTVSGAFKGGTVDSIKGGKSLDNHTHSYDHPEHVSGPANTSAAQ